MYYQNLQLEDVNSDKKHITVFFKKKKSKINFTTSHSCNILCFNKLRVKLPKFNFTPTSRRCFLIKTAAFRIEFRRFCLSNAPILKIKIGEIDWTFRRNECTMSTQRFANYSMKDTRQTRMERIKFKPKPVSTYFL